MYMYALYDTCNAAIISKHRTIAAVAKAKAKAKAKSRSQGSYVPTSLMLIQADGTMALADRVDQEYFRQLEAFGQ